jgi:hypothetical protein
LTWFFPAVELRILILTEIRLLCLILGRYRKCHNPGEIGSEIAAKDLQIGANPAPDLASSSRFDAGFRSFGRQLDANFGELVRVRVSFGSRFHTKLILWAGVRKFMTSPMLPLAVSTGDRWLSQEFAMARTARSVRFGARV